MGPVHGVAAEPKGPMHHLQRLDAQVFGHHTTGADFTGGDQLDIDARIGQGPEHCCGRAWGAGHARPHGADPGDGRSLFEVGSGPLLQQASKQAIDESGDYQVPLDSLPELITQLEDKMKVAAKNLEFEEAANLRDRIKKLRQKLVRRT